MSFSTNYSLLIICQKDFQYRFSPSINQQQKKHTKRDCNFFLSIVSGKSSVLAIAITINFEYGC